jgi:hypothetical protein
MQIERQGRVMVLGGKKTDAERIRESLKLHIIFVSNLLLDS